MFRTLIHHPSSGACDFSIVSPHWSCVDKTEKSQVCYVLEFRCGWVGVAGLSTVVLQPATRTPLKPSHTETPTHIETRTHDHCGDKIGKSQAPDDGCINVRNMLSIGEVKQNLNN